jgi:uncharacterized integral membrane protein
MNKFKLVLWIIILAVIALVIFQNKEFFLDSQSLQLNLWLAPVYQSPEIPIAVIFLVFFALGLLLDFLFSAPQRFRNRKAIKRLTAANASQKDEIEKLNKEIDSLKGVYAAAASGAATSPTVGSDSDGQADDANRPSDSVEK